MGEKICQVFLDFRSKPEPEPHQNQTAPKHWLEVFLCLYLWYDQTTKGGAKSGMNEYDKIATKYLSVGGLPIV